jgi:hypothetical protein
MNTTALRMVRRHFSSDLVSRALNRRNALAWVAARRMLGDRWLLAKPVNGASHA